MSAITLANDKALTGSSLKELLTLDEKLQQSHKKNGMK